MKDFKFKTLTKSDYSDFAHTEVAHDSSSEQCIEHASKGGVAKNKNFLNSLIGKRYDNLIILECVLKKNPNTMQNDIFKVKCDCGCIEEISYKRIKYLRQYYKNASCEGCLIFACKICDKLFNRDGTKAIVCSEKCRDVYNRERNKDYYSKNQEKINANKFEYRKKNIEAERARALKYYHEKNKGNFEYLEKKRPLQRASYYKLCDDPKKYKELLEKQRLNKITARKRKNLCELNKISQRLMEKVNQDA